MSVDAVKQELLAKLKQEHCFWSYNESSVNEVSDEILIEKTLLHLDLEEINQLFQIFSFKKIRACLNFSRNKFCIAFIGLLYLFIGLF